MAFWKKIKNSDAVPVLKEELVFDTEPTMNSTNPVTSDGVARAIAGGGGQITVDQNYNPESAHAQAGTAVAQAVAGKQDTINDLSAIRSGAALGATAVQQGTLSAVAVSGAYADLTGTPDLSLKEDVANKKQSIDASSQSDYPSSKAVADFVSDAVSSNSADYISDNGEPFDSVADLPTDPSVVGNNDYAIVLDGGIYYRYKATVSNNIVTWALEYQINTSPLSPAQLNAVNSGIDSTKVGNYDNHIADTTIHVTSADKTAWSGKQDAISDLSTIRSGAALGASAVQPGSLSAVATSGSYSDLSGRPTIPSVDQVYDAASTNAQSGVAVAGAISGKQDTIGDLSTIRSGAALGATAVQDANYVHTDNNFTNADVTKLSGIESGAQVNVKPDWNAASGSAAEILNKPTIPTVDQVYNSASANAQSGVAVAGAIAGVNQVPASTSSDEGKVLTVDAQGVPGWATGGGGGASYTAGDGIAIENDEISVRVKNDGVNPLKVSAPEPSGGDTPLSVPSGTPEAEGWQVMYDSEYVSKEYDSDRDETTITFRYLWNGSDPNPLSMVLTPYDDTLAFGAKLHLLWLSDKESTTSIVAASSTVSNAFTAGRYIWDKSYTSAVYSLGTLVDTTEAGYVFEASFTVSGDHTGDFNAVAVSASGSDFSGMDGTVQSSFLSESHMLALQGDSVFIFGGMTSGGDLYVDVATEWDPYSDKVPTCSAITYGVRAVPGVGPDDEGKVLTAEDGGAARWEMPTKVEYANQELTVQPPNSNPSLTIDTSNATPVTSTESYEERVTGFSVSTLIAEIGGGLGEKDLVDCTLHIPEDIEATGITLNDLELNYYQVEHGNYTEESVSPMVVTGATSASPSKILAGDYVVPLTPNPDPTYQALCIKITYSGSPDQADLDAFVTALSNAIEYHWTVTGDIRVVTGYSIKPAVLPSLTGNAGKVLAVNSGATGTEWVEQPSLSVTTDGVMAGTGSAQDPVVLNYGSGLSTVTSQTTTLANVTGISTNGTMTTSFELTAQDCAAINASIASGLAEVSMVPSASYSLIMDSAASADNNVRFELIDRNSNTHYYGPVVATIPQGQTSVTVDSSNFSRLPLDQFHVGSVSGPTLDGSTYALPASNDYVVVLSGDEYVDTYDSRTLTIDFVEAGVPQLVVSNPVPSIAGNAGKILAVNSSATGTEWVASNSYTFSTGLTTSGNTVSVTNPVPAVSGHAGQILAVNSGATGTEWVNAPSASVSATGVIAGNGTSPSPLQLNYNSTLTSVNGVIPEIHTQSLSWDNSNHLSGIAVTYADYNKLKNLGYSNVKLQLVFPSTYVCALTRQGSNDDCYLHIADTTGNYKGVSGGLGNVGTGYTVVPDLSNITLSSLGFTTENALYDGTYYIWFSTNYQAVSYQDEVGTMYNVFADYNPSLGDGTDTTTVVNIGATGAQLGVSNPVPVSAIADAGKVLTVDNSGAPAWSTPAAGGVTDVEVDGTSVVSGGVASITMPTVDQTYNSSSANAQSGTAVASAIAGKEDEFSAGDGLEFTTDGQGNRVLQVDETVLWEGTVGSTGAEKALSESANNFKTIRIYTQVSTGTSERCIQMFDMQLKFSSTQGLAFVHVDNISGGNLVSEIIYLKFNVSVNTFELLAGCKWSNGTFSQNISNYDFNVVKISGINRIASN